MRGSRYTADRRASAQRAAYDKAMVETRARHTCRQQTGEIGAAGECLSCSAEAGVACRNPQRRTAS